MVNDKFYLKIQNLSFHSCSKFSKSNDSQKKRSILFNFKMRFSCYITLPTTVRLQNPSNEHKISQSECVQINMNCQILVWSNLILFGFVLFWFVVFSCLPTITGKSSVAPLPSWLFSTNRCEITCAPLFVRIPQTRPYLAPPCPIEILTLWAKSENRNWQRFRLRAKSFEHWRQPRRRPKRYRTARRTLLWNKIVWTKVFAKFQVFINKVPIVRSTLHLSTFVVTKSDSTFTLVNFSMTFL